MEVNAKFAFASGGCGCRFSGFQPKTKRSSEFRDAELCPTNRGGSNHGCQRTLSTTRATVEPPSRVKDVWKGTFVTPEWLFPTEESVSTSGRLAAKEVDGSSVLFFVTVSTSQDDKSDISEPNVGVLISMIGENGKAILRTVPPVDIGFQTRFQAGSNDDDVFVGNDLGRLAALWIAPEKGTWRLAKARVIVLQWNKELDRIDKASRRDLNTLLLLAVNVLEKSTSQNWKGYVYVFESNETLLGVGDDMLAVELKPSIVQEYSDPAAMRQALLGSSSVKSGKIPSSYVPREEVERLRALSMKDYEALKLQFLGISSLLVGLGTAAFALVGEEGLTESFAAGGLGGFLYLLLLQRFVDQLPGPVTPAKAEDVQQQGSQAAGEKSFVVGVKFPASVALVAGIALLVGRNSQGGGAVSSITPQMLVTGIAGFLTSRVAVIVASMSAKSSSPDDDDG